MSPDSRYSRWLAPHDRLSDDELKYLTEVDHRAHEALVALDEDGGPVGVARFIREARGSGIAEVAVAVVDHWHRRGVATALVRLLAQRAESLGISHFSATCLASNREMIDILRRLGRATVTGSGEGCTEFRVALPADSGSGSALRHALRAVASGDVSAPRTVITRGRPTARNVGR